MASLVSGHCNLPAEMNTLEVFSDVLTMWFLATSSNLLHLNVGPIAPCLWCSLDVHGHDALFVCASQNEPVHTLYWGVVAKTFNEVEKVETSVIRRVLISRRLNDDGSNFLRCYNGNERILLDFRNVVLFFRSELIFDESQQWMIQNFTVK